jgi:hypothetical protein
MERRSENIILGLILFLLVSCEKKTQSANEILDITNSTKSQTTKDSFKITESKNQIDNPVNEFLTEKLKPIRDNFKKINSITTDNWSSIQTKSLEGTTEGGEATYYYWNADLSKIITKEYGETFQVLTEYYFLNKNLSFVFEKTLKYNRPIYWDKKRMKENNDTEVFDFERSEITEDRNYFEKGKLIHQLSSEDCGAPMSDEYLKVEQKRILSNFEKIMKLKNN